MTVASDAMLDRVLDGLWRTGFSELSLRDIAAAAGTSHRMLIYHFGSREGLLAQVVARMEASQRDLLTGLENDDDKGIFDVSRAFWEAVTAPEMLPVQRLFYEIYVQALYGRSWTDQFRASVMNAWEKPLIELYVRAGLTPSEARTHARLGLAVTRGLGLDLLMTGERAEVEAALELFGDLLRPRLEP